MNRPPKPLFVVGAPRSGTTIVTQVLNTHPQIKLFDEVSLIDVLEFGGSVVGKLRAFLMERGIEEDFRSLAAKGGDAAEALCRVMNSHIAPRTIWGEKNPMYATRLDTLRRGFPEAEIVFVLRDPRQVVNSYLSHRRSPFRSQVDFWIKDSASEASALFESCVDPILAGAKGLKVLRYEAFIAHPRPALNAISRDWNIRFQEASLSTAYDAPDSLGDDQFFRHGMPLPWKLGNLSRILTGINSTDRLDASDAAWIKVDALASRLGYN